MGSTAERHNSRGVPLEHTPLEGQVVADHRVQEGCMCHIVLGVEHIVACALKLLLLQRPHVASLACVVVMQGSVCSADGDECTKFEQRGQ